MSADRELKTEEPSGGLEHRARKLGSYPSSPWLELACGCGVGAVSLALMEKALLVASDLVDSSFNSISRVAVSPNPPGSSLNGQFSGSILSVTASALVPLLLWPLLAIVLGILVIALLQSGFRPRTPRFAPGNVFSFRRRRLSVRERMPGKFYRITSVLVLISLLAVCGLFVSTSRQTLSVGLPSVSAARIQYSIFRPASLFLAAGSCIVAIAGILDRMVRKASLLASLRLSPAEAREESRREEGDRSSRLRMTRRPADVKTIRVQGYREDRP